MRFMGLMLAIAALGVTSQAYAPPLHMTPGPDTNVDIQSNALRLNAPVAAAGSGPLCPLDPTGDCCTAHPEPGCIDPVCCELVCTEFSPFCCVFDWAQPCADAAAELCLCEPECPPAAGDRMLGGTEEVTLIGQWDGFGGDYADVWGAGDFAYIGHLGHAAVNIVDISDPPFSISVMR